MIRGEIYWAVLQPRSGSEQRGRRPVLIVSNDGFNQCETWNSIIVVPLTTSSRQGARGPTVVKIPESVTGKLGYAICHQITTLDRSKIDGNSILGELSEDLMAEVEVALNAALDLPIE